jgi:hypothetical protein
MSKLRSGDAELLQIIDAELDVIKRSFLLSLPEKKARLDALAALIRQRRQSLAERVDEIDAELEED